jgi:hypothetical protein
MQSYFTSLILKPRVVLETCNAVVTISSFPTIPIQMFLALSCVVLVET